MIDRLVLGTVQLGLPYGINNKTGKPDFRGACEIVKTAFDNGITRFDTAQAYGDSEEILGKAFLSLNINNKVKVYSKLDPKIDLSDEAAVRRSVDDSLCSLKIDRLDGLFLHHEGDLDFWDQGLCGVLQRLVTEGKVKSIGVSFYTPL
jgi:aryl-alcohol dehydrogenase-like predicted oxidoreductase